MKRGLHERLSATVLIVATAAGSYFLLATASRFSGHRARRYEAFGYAAQTLETLKNYVTQNNAASATQYELAGDDPIASLCSGGTAARHALDWFYSGTPTGAGHCHPLPTGPGSLASNYSGIRTYDVIDVDLDATIDSDGDSDPGNDRDVKKAIVFVSWTEPGQ